MQENNPIQQQPQATSQQTPVTPPPISPIIPPQEPQKKKAKIIFAAIALFVLAISIPVGIFLIRQNQDFQEKAESLHTFRGGYYINLAGGGANLSGLINDYNDEADCSPELGVCYSRKKGSTQNYTNGNVQKYICRGKVLNCDNTNSPGSVISGPDYSTAHYIYDTNYAPIQCNHTIQLDVFDGNGALKGFMTWYSGDCTGTPTPSPSPTPTLAPTSQPTQSPAPVSCNQSCTSDANCQGGLICSVGFCRNPQCITQSSCSCPTASPQVSATPSPSPAVGSPVTPTPAPTTRPTATPTPAPETPVAGTSLPTILFSLTGIFLLISAGFFSLKRN